MPRALRPWLLAWLLLTAASVALHAWLWPAGGIEPSGVPGPVRVVGNVVYTLNLPAWIALLWIHPPARFGGWVFAVPAFGVGWAAWLGLVFGVRTWRARVRPARGTTGPSMPERRRWMVEATTELAGAAVAVPVAYGTLVEPWTLRVTRYRLPVRDLPVELDGLRLALFADPHVGPRVPDEFITRAVSTTLDLKPDAILLLGDYIHAVTPMPRRAAELLAPLVASGIPMVGVRGNHDWRGGVDRAGPALRALGVRFIDNDRVFLDGSRRIHDEPPAGPALCLAGLGDLHEHEVDLAAALRGVPAVMPRLILAHQPATTWHPDLRPANTPGGPRIDAMVCGHTHGGQVNLPLVGSPAQWIGWMAGYTRGIDRRATFPVVVSSGIGLSLIPVRIGAPPEIVELTLVRDQA